MISGSPQETQAQLDEDLDRQSTRMAQMAVEGAGLSAAVTRRTALSKVQTQAHKDVADAKSDHEALKVRLYDALIDGTQTDPVAVAREIQASAALVETHIGKLRRVTEDRLPLANLEVLKAEKSVRLIALDLKILEGRIHNAQLLLAASPAAEVGGDLVIKSAVAQRIGLEEAQCASDVEAASRALEAELTRQQTIRDARASGPISFQNPS
jgi:hypothetical protein